MWLFGYDENGSPLKPESIFDDIMQDYAKKTVTNTVTDAAGNLVEFPRADGAV